MLSSDSGLLSTLSSFMLKIGSTILTGNFDLGTLLPPASCMSHLTLLEMYSYSFHHCIKYLKEAAELPKGKNQALERLKLISAGMIADLPTGIIESQANPPIPSFPGEFMEGKMSDGCYFKATQVSRAAKTINTIFDLTGPDEAFKIHVELDTFAHCRGMSDLNCILAGTEGTFEITLKDGTKYEYVEPDIMLHDYMKQNRLAQFYQPEGKAIGIIDKTNNIMCEFMFPEPDRSWSSWASGFVFNKEKVPLNMRCLINLRIKRTKVAEVLAKGWANYCSVVVWDDQLYWRLSDKFEKWNFDDPTINKGSDSVYNKPYTKLHRDGKFTELDVLMNEAESRTKT